MSQHQQTFLADNTSDVARVARRVLSMLASGRSSAGTSCAQEPGPICLEDMAQRLYAASFSSDATQFSAALGDIRRAGYRNDVVAFDLIPAIARQLGTSWEEDLISFGDVTIGCARLQAALHRLPDDTRDLASVTTRLRRDCLVMVPMGAQHTLGALVLAKRLRQRGQRVTVELEANEDVLSGLAQKQRVDVALISASRGESPERLRQLVGAARQHWSASKVMIGGSFVDVPCNRVAMTGADYVTKDVQEALDLCI